MWMHRVVSAACCKVTYGVRLVAFVMNQNVFRCYLVGERGGYLAAVVAQVEGDVYSIFRHRYEEYVLETLGVLLCLWIGEPFLEEGREGIAVDDFARAVVAYGYLSVAFYREFSRVAAACRTSVALR